ncbi:hypothetical protein FD755_004445 [Muntiacus reevesi]|uniref:Uncharacterized protein n=1 Tax=Muntiacus reevesi TaxID=9886 RepID=A0A5J5MQA3_MUNRE|nr:hypothetical protein FD755_004445 [Muntiacus reevesi]
MPATGLNPFSPTLLPNPPLLPPTPCPVQTPGLGEALTEKTFELTMKPDGPRLRLSSVVLGFLLLLVPGQGEAPAQGDIGTGVGLGQILQIL